MKKTSAVLASVLLGFLLGTPTTAQTLYLVTATATQDLTIGNGVQANRTAMLSTMSAIANILGLQFSGGGGALTVAAQNFSCANIRRAVRSLSPGGNDIVVFYYSGHGERSAADVSPLPSLACNDLDDPVAAREPRLTLQEVVHDLTLKGARLILVVADTCNYQLPAQPQQLSVAALGAPETAAYRRLFLGTSGVIVVDSSSPGEFSWYTAQGGRFTDQFIATLKHPPGGSTGATWDSFLAKVLEPIVIPVSAPIIVPGRALPLLQAGQTVLESPQALVRITEEPQ